MDFKNWKTLPTETLIRTWAICWVVLNHAHVYGPVTATWTGGMTVLIMLSGFSFARTALATGDAAIVRANLLRLCKILFIPSALVVLASFALSQEVRWTELAMISNWVRPDHLARMPLWYVQTMIQMALALTLVFSLPFTLSAFNRRPMLASFIALLGATGLHLVSMQIYDTSHLYHRLPTLLLWNFVLGWCVHFLAFSDAATPYSKLLVILCAVVAGALAWPINEPKVYWLVGCTTLLVLHTRLTMPSIVAWFVSVCSQALLAIFVLHGIFLGLFRAVFDIQVPVLAALFALTASVLTWSILIATIRTDRAIRQGALQTA